MQDDLNNKKNEIHKLEQEVITDIKMNFSKVKEDLLTNCAKLDETKEYNTKVIKDFYQTYRRL